MLSNFMLIHKNKHERLCISMGQGSTRREQRIKCLSIEEVLFAMKN